MNWSSLHYIVHQLEQDTHHRPTAWIAWERSMILCTSLLHTEPLVRRGFIGSYRELSPPDIGHSEGHPDARSDMTMFDRMTSTNVPHQDEDLASLIKCVNWNKNSIVNISDWEEQKDPLSTSSIVLYF